MTADRDDGDATEPGSPCISLCRIDERSGLCEGCMRSLDEIAAWGTMNATDKRRVWTLLAQRRASTAAPAAAATASPTAAPAAAAPAAAPVPIRTPDGRS
jgi:uncharacterized protein